MNTDEDHSHFFSIIQQLPSSTYDEDNRSVDSSINPFAFDICGLESLDEEVEDYSVQPLRAKNNRMHSEDHADEQSVDIIEQALNSTAATSSSAATSFAQKKPTKERVDIKKLYQAKFGKPIDPMTVHPQHDVSSNDVANNYYDYVNVITNKKSRKQRLVAAMKGKKKGWCELDETKAEISNMVEQILQTQTQQLPRTETKAEQILKQRRRIVSFDDREEEESEYDAESTKAGTHYNGEEEESEYDAESTKAGTVDEEDFNDDDDDSGIKSVEFCVIQKPSFELDGSPKDVESPATPVSKNSTRKLSSSKKFWRRSSAKKSGKDVVATIPEETIVEEKEDASAEKVDPTTDCSGVRVPADNSEMKADVENVIKTTDCDEEAKQSTINPTSSFGSTVNETESESTDSVKGQDAPAVAPSKSSSSPKFFKRAFRKSKRSSASPVIVPLESNSAESDTTIVDDTSARYDQIVGSGFTKYDGHQVEVSFNREQKEFAASEVNGKLNELPGSVAKTPVKTVAGEELPTDLLLEENSIMDFNESPIANITSYERMATNGSVEVKPKGDNDSAVELTLTSCSVTIDDGSPSSHSQISWKIHGNNDQSVLSDVSKTLFCDDEPLSANEGIPEFGEELDAAFTIECMLHETTTVEGTFRVTIEEGGMEEMPVPTSSAKERVSTDNDEMLSFDDVLGVPDSPDRKIFSCGSDEMSDEFREVIKDTKDTLNELIGHGIGSGMDDDDHSEFNASIQRVNAGARSRSGLGSSEAPVTISEVHQSKQEAIQLGWVRSLRTRSQQRMESFNFTKKCASTTEATSSMPKRLEEEDSIPDVVCKGKIFHDDVNESVEVTLPLEDDSIDVTLESLRATTA